MQVLLDRKADIEAMDNLEWTPLHLAAQRGHVVVVKVRRRIPLLYGYKRPPT